MKKVMLYYYIFVKINNGNFKVFKGDDGSTSK